MTEINDILKNCGFVRETSEDLLNYIIEGCPISNVISKIISSQTPKTDLFCLSVYLYDYKPNTRNQPYDFYFFCNKLYEQPIINSITNEQYTFTYKYDPILEAIHHNPCHFIFRVRDSEGKYLPRTAESKSEQKRNTAFAKFIYENFLTEAVCINPKEMIPWETENNYLLEKFI